MSEWIPVAQRLPETNVKVLVCLIDNRRKKVNARYKGEKKYSIRIDKLIKYTDACEPFWAKGNTPSVLAWMPLPEPWEGNE